MQNTEIFELNLRIEEKDELIAVLNDSLGVATSKINELKLQLEEVQHPKQRSVLVQTDATYVDCSTLNSLTDNVFDLSELNRVKKRSSSFTDLLHKVFEKGRASVHFEHITSFDNKQTDFDNLGGSHNKNIPIPTTNPNELINLLHESNDELLRTQRKYYTIIRTLRWPLVDSSEPHSSAIDFNNFIHSFSYQSHNADNSSFVNDDSMNDEKHNEELALLTYSQEKNLDDEKKLVNSSLHKQLSIVKQLLFSYWMTYQMSRSKTSSHATALTSIDQTNEYNLYSSYSTNSTSNSYPFFKRNSLKSKRVERKNNLIFQERRAYINIIMDLLNFDDFQRTKILAILL
ncbi:hypothetical protein SNEBB_001916 [Seison nebaliae]|nr:hypothetical protein SNEBB_001916 [Seison nebaliae]